MTTKNSFSLQTIKDPTPQQLNVFNWITNSRGSLELVARAGCGKTTTLMGAIEIIYQQKLGDVAIMAYNKAIAEELKQRLVKMEIDWKLVTAGTVHSFGFSTWRQVVKNVKVDEKKVHNIIATFQTGVPGDLYTECSTTIAKLVSLAKQRAVGHLSKIEDQSQWFDIWEHFGLDDDLTDVYSADVIITAAQHIYRLSLQQCRNVVDFDDMILAPLYYQARFWPKDWVMVDESQDTNPARRALALAMLKPRTGRMIFVGDDRQAIYGFSGASSDAMAQLKAATNATTLPLTVTYRCPKAIVKLAQQFVPDIIAHESAPQGIVRTIHEKDLLNENLSKQDVILCRNTAPLVQQAYVFLSNGIACRVEGREIGSGLIKLARRWKIKTLDKLLNKLDDHLARQTAKFMSQGKEEKIEQLQDQVECLRVIINRCFAKNIQTVDGLVAEIESMFGDTPPGQPANVLTLSTCHKSKGREWPRVFILGRKRFMPSPYARKPWQQLQEANLEYVAITRSKQELVDVIVEK